MARQWLSSPTRSVLPCVGGLLGNSLLVGHQEQEVLQDRLLLYSVRFRWVLLWRGFIFNLCGCEPNQHLKRTKANSKKECFVLLQNTASALLLSESKT